MKLGTALFALLAVAACDHRPEDYGRVRASAASFEDGWGRRVREVDDRHTALFARASALPPETPGLADVLSSLNGVDAQLTEFAARPAAVRTEVEQKVTEKRRRLADEALDRGDKEMQATIVSLTAELDRIGTALDGLEATRAADQAAKAPPPPPAQLGDPGFARQPGTADVAGVVFKPGTAQIDLRASKPAIDRLVAFAATCPELRFGITGHTAKDGDKNVNARLSGAQAEALRQALVRAGVAAEKIANVAGVGGERPVLAEPEPGSPEEKTMATDQLAAIRAQNRRVSITVMTPCAAPPS